MFRTVLETMRTLFVWLVDLLLFYTPLGMGNLGESWSAWSYLQAAGCASVLPSAQNCKSGQGAILFTCMPLLMVPRSIDRDGT